MIVVVRACYKEKKFNFILNLLKGKEIVCSFDNYINKNLLFLLFKLAADYQETCSQVYSV